MEITKRVSVLGVVKWAAFPSLPLLVRGLKCTITVLRGADQIPHIFVFGMTSRQSPIWVYSPWSVSLLHMCIHTVATKTRHFPLFEAYNPRDFPLYTANNRRYFPLHTANNPRCDWRMRQYRAYNSRPIGQYGGNNSTQDTHAVSTIVWACVEGKTNDRGDNIYMSHRELR